MLSWESNIRNRCWETETVPLDASPQEEDINTMRTHNLFISHSWSYIDHYGRLVELLRNRPYFSFRNYSVPKDDPVHTDGTARELRAAIRRKMAPCGVVLILAGVYATYSKWINEEIDLAKQDFRIPKPIVAIEPWGSQRTSVPVKHAADRIVKWNTNSIVTAIRAVAR